MSSLKDHKKRHQSIAARHKSTSSGRSSGGSIRARKAGLGSGGKAGAGSSTHEASRANAGSTAARRTLSRDDVRVNQLRSAQRKRRSSQKSTGKVKRSIRPTAGAKIMRRLPLIAGVLGALLVIYGVVTFAHWMSIRKYDTTKIADNVRIGTIDVSGMTKKEAQKALKKRFKEAKKQTVTLNVGDDSTDVELKELGLSIMDYKKLAAKALVYGSSGSVNKRYKRLKALKKEAYVVPLTYQIDEKEAAGILQTVCAPLLDSPVNATMTFKGKKMKITEGKDGMVADVDKTISALEKKLNGNWDSDTLVVNVPTKKSAPKVNAEQLKGMKDELGSFETSFEGSDEGRCTNIELGCELINGTVVEPGETFSADAAMRPYTEERGWAAAASYESGDIVDTLGGGICQISSTLYNAVLYAELEVVQRQPHSRRVSYVDPGRDAAIAGDVKDFKFKNNTKNPVYIYGNVKDQKLEFAIYGKETRDKDREIEFESEVLETTDFTTVYKGSSDPIGQMYISASGHEGMTAKLWKTVTVDGKESEPEEVNESQYLPQNTIINVGLSGSAGAANMVAAALNSQDEATIRKAIAAARGM